MSSLSLAVRLRATASLPALRLAGDFVFSCSSASSASDSGSFSPALVALSRSQGERKGQGKREGGELALLLLTSLKGRRPRLKMGSHSASLSTEADAGTPTSSSRARGARKASINAGYAFKIVLLQSVRTLTDSCRLESLPLLPRRGCRPRWTPAAMLNLPRPKPSHPNS